MAELRNRNTLEGSFQRRFVRLNKRHRERLRGLLGNPPDERNVPESFWQEVRQEIASEALLIIILIWETGALQHGLSKSRVESGARLYSSERSETIASQWTQNSKEMLRTAQRNWDEIADTGRSVLDKEIIGPITSVFGEARAERMAVTETTAAASDATETAMEEQGLKTDRDIWVTVEDERVCPICRPLHLTTRRVWTREFSSGPPAHVSCRCFLRPANQAQAIAAGINQS